MTKLTKKKFFKHPFWLSISLLLGGVLLTSQTFANEVSVAYLDLKKDQRYRDSYVRAQHQIGPFGRPFAGAKTASKEFKFVGKALGLELKLKHQTSKNRDELLQSLQSLYASGVKFFLLDLPYHDLLAISQASKDMDLLLFNVSARDDRLRQQFCQKNLYHLIPNFSMLTDATAQLLITRKWRKVLVLEGPSEQDKALGRSFMRSAKRHGIKVLEKRQFLLSNDPRKRQQSNVALLTGGLEYDAIFVADTYGEFARNVPYRTIKPRPVFGAAGLVADSWHWSWERNGAPQLNKRFEKQSKRHMTGFDWAAWVGVKVISEALSRTKSDNFNVLHKYISSKQLVVDGFKGNRLNFRPWDNQLRQPILLTTGNWVSERTPLPGFLHRSEDMDTLGFDQHESQCHLK